MKRKKLRIGFLSVLILVLLGCTATDYTTTPDNTEGTNGVITAVPTTASLDHSPPAIISPTNIQIEHNGISLTYDPALLGEANIQDVSATADQDMFGLPTPAHSWIGFLPTGSQQDASNHWWLTREPQIIVFNISNFGSFAMNDTMARERVVKFQPRSRTNKENPAW